MSAFKVPTTSTRQVATELHEPKLMNVASLEQDTNTDHVYHQTREIHDCRISQETLEPSKLNIFYRRVTFVRKKCNWFVNRREFEGFITLCIVINTIVMATEHHNMSSTLKTVIAVSNYVSVTHLIFFIESGLK